MVSRLREILAGTGAEILQAEYPVVFVWRDRFAIVTPEEDDRVMDRVSFAVGGELPFKRHIMATHRSRQNRGEQDVREWLGGKKIIAYDAPEDFLHDDGTVRSYKLRFSLWTPP